MKKMLLTLLVSSLVLASCKQPENQSISIREPYQRTMKVGDTQSLYLDVVGFELPGIGQPPLFIKVLEGQNSIFTVYLPTTKTIELMGVAKGSVLFDIYTPNAKNTTSVRITVIDK